MSLEFRRVLFRSVWAGSTYDGTPNPASATATGVAADGNLSPTPSLTYYPGSDTLGTALAGAPTNAGTYTVLASFAGNNNYNSSSATRTIVISPAASAVHITWSASIYNGSANAASATVSGVLADGDLPPHPSFTYYPGSNLLGTALAGAPTNAGTYTV